MTYRRLILLIICCLLAATVLGAEIAPQRLALLRGAILLAGGQSDALADLQQAASLAREDWRSQLLYGEALAMAGQAAAAKGALRRAALLAPWRPEPWQAIARAGRLQGDGFLEYAGLAGLTRIFPDDPLAQYRLSFLCRILGKPAEADNAAARWKASLPPPSFNATYPDATHPADLRELRQLAAQHPNARTLIAALAAAAWHAGNGDEACEALDRLHRLAPDDRMVQRNLVHALLVMGRIDDARKHLRAFSTGDDALERSRAAWSLASGDYADAIPALLGLCARYPKDASLQAQLGVATSLTGDLATALTAWQAAMTHRPDDRVAQGYAATLVAAGKLREAETVLLAARQRFPQETILALPLITIYRDTGRLLLAAQLTERLAPQRPEAIELLILAGERFLEAGDAVQAGVIARQLRDRYPDDRLAARGAVDLFRRLDYATEAKVTLTRYLGPNIASPYSRAELMCELARVALEDSNLIEAQTALEDCITREPDYQPAYRLMGKVLQQQGLWVKAMECYRTACIRWPRDEDFALNLARAARKSGDLLQAIDGYRRATSLINSGDPWLELGEACLLQGDVSRARDCWQLATRFPASRTRATLYLMLHRDGEAPAADDPELQHALAQWNDERAARTASWQAALATYGLAANEEELNTLLLLDGALQLPLPIMAMPHTGDA